MNLNKFLFDDEWRRKRPSENATWTGWIPPPPPEPVYIRTDEWPTPTPRDDLVFAKSCTPDNWCRTDAGTTPEPASHFGKVMVAGALRIPAASHAVAKAIGADLALGRMAGGGILQQRLNWAIRGAGGPASVFILGMLPTRMGDGTLHTDEQLRSMSRATTRVRFQFRRDAEGVMQVYGIHTGASGDDSVRTVKVEWNNDKSAMEAKLNDITILWTPQRGPLGSMPPLVHPEHGEALSTILVHPIAANTDSQIEILPGEDITAEDCILVFPAETGLKSLYVVFSKPARLMPGTVTGVGEDVSGVWLDHARGGSGAPIPTSIADSLRGREYSSFDSFRRAFWAEASKDTRLAGQLSEDSLERMRNGKAPRARLADAAGKRISHEIHHVELISQGGEVYNVDNLRVHTPKNHVEIHQD
ncbi:MULTISPECIES: S-type pyocin domain-containing protein [Pseudomonas]|uniref:Putative pyocin n=1 Tax=Pseudomonas fluorescens (strain Pf0-1) TaxID=205922 RepID=Q3K6V8_PSEPF|nr:MULTISPECIES: S-type pyocin domain-containing protein [Pseudomonas]ABA76496.1 Putative pyocin [Pseudomonas fluorescens Pf0-1]MBL0794349.1 S-type pyocin domain-containing protein [Pseudomonas sp. B7]MBY9024424.1 S-type pyocin domain-containing protein [Pseudomonas fluorescens]MBY9032926.1 S-type pyocin domain-containing protein [Pseudomonas fluorescens]MBY9035659.1 S-type pyocin domain-containing protein [Pseudomonas fluorescens]